MVVNLGVTWHPLSRVITILFIAGYRTMNKTVTRCVASTHTLHWTECVYIHTHTSVGCDADNDMAAYVTLLSFNNTKFIIFICGYYPKLPDR
jgi:hypothetical protein